MGLVGYCYDQGEQMLVYEFITMREWLAGEWNHCRWLHDLAIFIILANFINFGTNAQKFHSTNFGFKSIKIRILIPFLLILR